MRSSLVAGNWKMHGTVAEISAYCEGLCQRLAQRPQSAGDKHADVVLFPPAVFLQHMVSQVNDRVECGLQDIGISPSGAHTGEIAAEMVADVGGRWSIVGHSERRLDQDEKDDLVATKAAAAMRGGLRPIVCVGETLAEREAGKEIAVVERQLDAVLDRLDLSDLAAGAIGYEPVWAIGTGETATPDQAQAMHAFIRARLAEVNAEAAANIRIVYGGSVNPQNADELFAEEDIDGGLVGGASLNAEQFFAIIEAAYRA